MYKINEAAAMLGVDKIIIYEKLIHNSGDLEVHTQKKNGITFIRDEGIELLRHLIYKNEKHLHRDKNSSVGMPSEETMVDKSGVLHRPQWIIDKSEIDKRVRMFSTPKEVHSETPDVTKINTESTNSSETTESSSLQAKGLPSGHSVDVISAAMKSEGEFGQAVEDIKQILAEKAALKHQIAELRSGLIALDSDIKRKDDAIVGYHKLMKEDLEWLWDIEAKLLKYMGKE